MNLLGVSLDTCFAFTILSEIRTMVIISLFPFASSSPVRHIMAASMKTYCVRVTGVHCIPARRTVSVAAKPDIHPEYHEESPVFCNGEQVMTVGGTKPKYVVDVYSGNHPLYLGQKGNVVVNNGQLHK